MTLRPLGSTLPLGALTLVPAGTLLAGRQLGWFPANEAPIVAYALLGFAVPLQLVASVLAFLARDSLVGTGFAVFTGIWLAFGLTTVSGSVGETSRVLGVFFLCCAAVFLILVGGGIAGGKAAAGAVILFGSVRFVLSGLYELTGSSGVEHAAGIVGLVFVAVAGYVGLATLLRTTRTARSCRSGAAVRRARRSTRVTGRSSAMRSSARPASASSSSYPGLQRRDCQSGLTPVK